MALTNNSYIKITSGSTVKEFCPQSYKITYESLAGDDSGRTDDGTMHISWVLTKIVKLEVTLPPHAVNDTTYSGLINLVQGKTYTVEYYDYLSGQVRTTTMYTSNSSAEWYSGVILNGLVQGVTFNCIEMAGRTN